MRIVKIFIWTEWAGVGQGLRLGEVGRMKCLVTGEDSIALGPNKLVYTFLVAQFLMSTGKPETHPAHTHWNTHTLTHTQTLASWLVCACVVLRLGCWHFSVAAFCSRTATSRSNTVPFFSSSWSLQFSLFISGFAFFYFCFFFVIAFFILFMLLSLHFTAIALAFKHKNLQQFFVLGLTKICFAKYEG